MAQANGHDKGKPTEQRVYIVRHGERVDLVDPSWVKTAQNPDDPPLTKRGVQQARELGLRMRQGTGKSLVQYIYTSPFLRTAQTAQEVANVVDMPVFLEPGLCEGLITRLYPMGKPKVLPPAQLQQQLSRVNTMYKSPFSFQYPENYRDARQRCAKTIAHLLEKHPTENLLLVCHGLCVEYLAQALVEEEKEVALQVPYCSVTECVRTLPYGPWRFGVKVQDDFLSEPESTVMAEKEAKIWGLQPATA